MRVELIYAPGCSSFGKARNTLEMVIAEERLPIPVELVEASDHQDGSPTIRIDGNVIHSIKHHYEDLRDSLSRRWRELNHDPLAST